MVLSVLLVLSLGVSRSAAEIPVSGEPGPARISLAGLEPLVGSGPEVMVVLSELARDEALWRGQRQGIGAKVFAGLAYGYNDEPVNETSDEMLTYAKLTARAGLSFPLFGSWNREKIDLLQAELQALQGKDKVEATRARNLTALRKAYCALWVEGRRARLLREYLEDERTVVARLAERTAAGQLLEADRQEFMAGFSLARKELAASMYRRVQALSVVRVATGLPLSHDAVLDEPIFPLLPEDSSVLRANVDSLPETRMYAQALAFRRRILDFSRNLDLTGDLEVGGSGGKDFPGSVGEGAYVSLNIRKPLAALRSGVDERWVAASADLARVEGEARLSRIRLETELDEGVALEEFARVALETGEQRVGSACESLRMNRLRYGVLPGDTYEKLQQSRTNYFKAALELFDAESLALQARAELLRFADPGELPQEPDRSLVLPRREVRARLFDRSWLAPIPADSVSKVSVSSVVSAPGPLPRTGISAPPVSPSPAEALVGMPTRAGRSFMPVAASASPEPAAVLPSVPRAPAFLGAYVWRSAVFLDPATREQALGAVAFRGISHLLLSFDAGQIGNLRTGVGRGALLDFLELARRREIRVDLLLGDPTWILPEHRQELVDLVALFEGLPFRGVHLDLEPDQLPDAGARRAALFGDMLSTLRAVRERTRRPLSISIHPRYLEAGIVPPSGERLEDLGLEEVLVMIYSTREASVRERMGALMARHPGLRLGLAQSVEPTLPPEESYASSGRRIFLERVASLEGALDSPAFGGIFIQSWKDYLEMRL